MIQNFGVVGAGQMGSGIAQVAAQSGMSVVLVDAVEGLASAARERILKAYGKLVEEGKLTAGARESALARLSVGHELEAQRESHVVVGAIVEDERHKRRSSSDSIRSRRPSVSWGTPISTTPEVLGAESRSD